MSTTREDATYDCLSALAGVDTHDTNLCHHPDAWAVLEAFAEKLLAAEREACAALVECKALCRSEIAARIRARDEA